jgi:beta-galactosidase
MLASLFVVVAGMVGITTEENTPMRERILMDDGWKFALGNAADPDRDFEFRRGRAFLKAGEVSGALGPQFDDSGWRVVDLPHDWAVELPFLSGGDDLHKCHGFKPVGGAFPETTIGWYRKAFEIPASDKGRRLALEFDGVYRDCTVWLNGHYLGRNESGYSSFRFDITDVAEYGGLNVLVVRVDASQYEGWFYEGAGIYRHVWLTKTAPLHIGHWGICVRPEVKGDSAAVTILTTIANESDKPATFQLTSVIGDPSKKSVARGTTRARTIEPWSEIEVTQEITVKSPHLWSLDDPYLYEVVSTVQSGHEPVDETVTAFGIRTIRFDKDKGFFLNGKRVEIKGACCHQDHAGVGAALPDRLQHYRIERLKEYGFNAYRTSHNPPTPELLDACDRLGMLVMDENRLLGSSDEVLGQLTRLVLRDRNHPSVVLWSLANEEPEETTERGGRIGATMIRTIRELDPTRPITQASNAGNADTGVNAIVDVRGFNYMKVSDLDAYRREHPDQPLVGTEEASTLCTRGIYAIDRERGYMSSYDVSEPGWGATAEGWWSFFADREWLAGSFVWTGFDYRGEPTPYGWPCISSHFGVLDTCGLPKDNAFYYKACWTEEPVLHILPHWNWPGREGQVIDVWCFSNLDEVELLLNGTSLGRQATVRNGHIEWKVAYEPGVLEAKGYKDGRLVKTTRVETTGEPAAITLSPDRSTIAADGRDVSVVNVSTVDAEGQHVATAGNMIRFELEGPGRIIGVGNGDPSCHEPDKYISQPTVRRIEDWRMKIVDAPEERPEVAAEYEDSAWDRASIAGDARGLPQNATGVYRASFDLGPAQVRGEWRLGFGQIDDLGWVYVNGRLVGTGDDWSHSWSFDVTGTIRPGRNVVAVVVQNQSGPGGLGRGATVVGPGEEPQWCRSLFNGYAQVIVQSTGKTGRIVLRATGDRLETAEARIDCVQGGQ